ncbi:MAG: cupin domain-containing protein [Saprospiraceae bacterium]
MKAKIISSANFQSNTSLQPFSINHINQNHGENNLVYADLVLATGEALDFHQHPNQTETFHLLTGELEIWIGHSKSKLFAGETITIKAGTTHACFNTSKSEVRIFSILSSEKDNLGFEIIDKSNDYPWCNLR